MTKINHSLIKWSRSIHRWGSLIITLPLLLVTTTGVLLLFKKQCGWIQPPSRQGSSQELTLRFDEILAISKTVPEANIHNWQDIDRLDVRPSKGMVKVRSKNRYEIQLDTNSGDILQVAYRRSDLIESIHDGSFFHPAVKLWVVLPTGVILSAVCFSGLYLFFSPYIVKRKKLYCSHDSTKNTK